MELAPGVEAFFTGRAGGVSEGPYASFNLSTRSGDHQRAVDANRAILERGLGVPVVFMNPTHGASVAVIGPDDDPRALPAAADILLTTRGDIGLAALAADCVPVLAHDPVSGAIAAAHVGREGLRVGAVEALADALEAARAAVEPAPASAGHDFVVAIGPSICGRCYEVSAALRDAVTAAHPAAASETRAEMPSLDLPAAIEAVLGTRGGFSVTRDPRCTMEDPGLYSYRRDGVTGRQAGVIVRKRA